MILDVSPTRMTRLALKKKLRVAQKGHKLLKDKLDQLVKNLLELVKEVDQQRKDVDARFVKAQVSLALAQSDDFDESITAIMQTANRSIDIKFSIKKILNVKIPEAEILIDTPLITYGFVQTSFNLDKALKIFDQVVRELIMLATKEKSIAILAEEVKKTKRRVNALEYLLIPNIIDTIKFIEMRLDEQERNTKTQIMKIKSNLKAQVSSLGKGASGHIGTRKLHYEK